MIIQFWRGRKRIKVRSGSPAAGDGSMVERTTANTVFVAASSLDAAALRFNRYLMATDEEAIEMLRSGGMAGYLDQITEPGPVWLVTTDVRRAR